MIPVRPGKLAKGLARTRRGLTQRLASWMGRGEILPEEFWEECEAALIQVDLGVETVVELLDSVRSLSGEVETAEQVREALVSTLADMLVDSGSLPASPRPRVILLVGVNGSGKTTTAAKLARHWSRKGEKVLLAAADTYRAAAIEQLRIWAERVEAEFISQGYGADPAAVAFDAYAAARRREIDLLLIDTAGRLHNREDLMRQMGKMMRVLTKAGEGVAPEVYLVLDATVGQNGLAQAEGFASVAPLSGIILSKVDGTARGGIVVAISRRLGLPVRYLGVGEGLEDLVDFDPGEFARSLLAWDDGATGKDG